MGEKPRIRRREFLQQAAASGCCRCRADCGSGRPGADRESVNRKIKVGLIGCGSVSNVYLPNLSQSPYVELVSSCDIIPQRAQRQANRFGIPHHYPHIDQMLAGAAFDLLVNLTDMQEHERLNRQAIEAGKHVWSEKPMANSLVAGEALLDQAKAKGVRIWGAPTAVNSPQFAFMAKALARAAWAESPRPTPITATRAPTGPLSSIKKGAEACPTWASTT